MKTNASSRLFSADQQNSWRMTAPGIWSATVERPEESPALSIMTTLWDQPRWLEAYHLYDERGSDLFEKICELPEYYLTRTENSILEREASRIIAAAPVEAIVELGAGSSKKTTHLLAEQLMQRGGGIFVPIDVSLPGLVTSREFVQANSPELEFEGLHALYEEGFSSIDPELPKLIVFRGSTIGNFNHTEFARFFRQLSGSMGPRDFLLLGADRVKPVQLLEKAYNDSQALTAEFILNVFRNVNRLLRGNFDVANMRYDSRYNREWQRIEMYSVAKNTQDVEFRYDGSSFRWEKDEKILVEISRKFDPIRLQQQLRYFGLLPVAHYTDPQEWFSLLLFKKAA
jgi:L-histidine N-alpha-methyltransferase